MASVGKASLTIVPKFDNLGKSVTRALDGVDVVPSGERMGRGVSDGVARGAGGLATSGALIGVFSAATNKAMDLVSSSVGSAAARLDTLNNYPRVMQSLGYSADESEASISKMSDRLSGLPTALDDMAQSVKGIAAITGDLNLATDAGLALNDMLLASGSSTQLAQAAMEQFRQMLSKGKPEMEDWKSLVSAMPGQMDQLAKSMLGPTANANDLYAALGGGNKEAILSTDDLMRAMIRLDTEGGPGITSFADQARSATEGIEASAANMETSVTRGVAKVLDSIGSDSISAALGGVGRAFEGALGVVGDVVSAAKPIVAGFVSVVGEIAPSAVPAAAGLAGLAAAGRGLGGLASVVEGASGAFDGVRGTAKAASDSLLALAASMKNGGRASETLLDAAGALGGAMGGPLVAGIGAAVVVGGLLVGAYLEAREKSETLEKATRGLADAVGDTLALEGYSGSISDLGSSAAKSAMSVEDLAKSMAETADAIGKASAEAESEIAALSSAQRIIGDYAGATDLSADAQGRLKWALDLVNEQFGVSIDAADVMAGKYEDASGATVDLKASIDGLVESKRREIEMEAMSANLTAVYEQRANAAATLAERQDAVARAQQNLNDILTANGENPWAYVDPSQFQLELEKANEELGKAEDMYRGAVDAAAALEEELGDASRAASGAADEFDRFGDMLDDLFKAKMQPGTTISGLKDDLRSLGASTEDLSALSESELGRIADAYDGTASSIVGVLGDIGVGMDDARARTATASESMAAAIESMGLSLDGVDVGMFCDKLAEAGVSTERLNEIGSLNLAQLSESCGGSIDEMVYFIQHYNETPIVDKNGFIAVDDASLLDAQGNLYTWNGSTLLDKDGIAVVDDLSLIDAQGNVWTWNGTDLQIRSTVASVEDGSVEDAILTRDRWNDGSLMYKETSATINIFRNITDFFTGGSGHASGGFRLNADGGFRFHGAGAIATRAVPLDIVGEDGAEAIVPLTNRRYSIPFAKTLAEQMGEAGGGMRRSDIDDVLDALETIASILRAIYGKEAVARIDGRSIADTVYRYIERDSAGYARS